MIIERPYFWNIKGVWIFYILAAFTVIAFLTLVSIYIWNWKKNVKDFNLPFSSKSLKITIIDILLMRRLFKGDIPAGIMHFFLFWGFLLLFLGTIILAIHHYIHSFLVGSYYLIFSFLMDLAGLLVFIGTLWALIRRYVQKVERLENTKEDAIILLWLILVISSGFFLESLRLAYQRPSWGRWSFVGWFISFLFSPSVSLALYPYMWWAHVIFSLCFILLIPSTKLFHIISAPLSIFLNSQPEKLINLGEPLENKFGLNDLVFFDSCIRCGRCVSVCPSYGAGEPYSPREFIQAIRYQLWKETSPFGGDIRIFSSKSQIEIQEKLWYCTTCRACLEVCPVYGATFEIVLKERELAIEEGTGVPDILNRALEKVVNYDNPWMASKNERIAWAKDLDITDITRKKSKIDICYFVGCTTSFDSRAQGIAKAFSQILKIAGINFGILGTKEPCCGDIAKRVGEWGLFQEKMEICLELFSRYEIKDIVTSSPHCFHTFKNDYINKSFRVRHYSLLLHELIADGKIRFKSAESEKVVTYHDPCYLGRHNRIFKEPREVLKSIPGVRLVEMAHSGVDSLCCGGGGGRMWQGPDLKGKRKMSEIRLEEAIDTGARIIVTACPLCLMMLEDAVKGMGLEKEMRVMDLSEIVLESIKID